MADRAIYHLLMVAFPPPAVGEFAQIGRGEFVAPWEWREGVR